MRRRYKCIYLLEIDGLWWHYKEKKWKEDAEGSCSNVKYFKGYRSMKRVFAEGDRYGKMGFSNTISRITWRKGNRVFTDFEYIGEKIAKN